MKKYTIFFVVLIVAVVIFAYKFDTQSDLYEHREMNIGGKSFDMFVSDTDELREKGLSGFSGLKDNQAMLFIFPEPGLYGFWMKNMLFPIDIMWLDSDFNVVYLEKNVSPDTYPKSFFPVEPAKYVVEFTAGTIEKLRL